MLGTSSYTPGRSQSMPHFPISVVLPDEYTPIVTFQTKLAEVDSRLAALESGTSGPGDNVVAALQADIAALAAEVEKLRATTATASSVETLTLKVNGVTTDVTGLRTQLSDFSFSTGDYAAFKSAGELEAGRLFFIVDTPDNLAPLYGGVADDKVFAIALGKPTTA